MRTKILHLVHGEERISFSLDLFSWAKKKRAPVSFLAVFFFFSLLPLACPLARNTGHKYLHFWIHPKFTASRKWRNLKTSGKTETKCVRLYLVVVRLSNWPWSLEAPGLFWVRPRCWPAVGPASSSSEPGHERCHFSRQDASLGREKHTPWVKRRAQYTSPSKRKVNASQNKTKPKKKKEKNWILQNFGVYVRVFFFF